MLNRIILTVAIALLPSLAFGQANWNDYSTDDTIVRLTNTFGQNGEVATITSEDILIVKDGATVLTTGITVDDDVSLDFGGGAATKPGLHKITIVLTTSGYDDGDYEVIYKAGTVDTIDVDNTILATFSIGRNAAAPTNFESLSVDGSGAVTIQDGTDPGQIATTGGAIDTVTTLTQLTAATTEPTSVPSATAGFIDKVNWLFLIARNKKTVTDALIQWFADDGTTVIGEAVLDPNSDTEVTQAEATDP